MNNVVEVDMKCMSLNLPKYVADAWENNIDGIVCASALMEYQLDIGVDSNYKKKEGVLTVGFYKGEDFCFEVRFNYHLLSRNVSRIVLHYNQDFYSDKPVDRVAFEQRLEIDFYNCIEVKSEEQMKNLFNFIRFLL
jgi:hypothetical protein